MASLVLSGDTSGSITLAAPAVAGSTTQTLVNVTDTLAPVVSGTAVASTSGTSINFTGIPSWVKRITVMFSGVSTSGTSALIIQLGAGSIDATSYLGASMRVNNTSIATANLNTGFLVVGSGGNGATSILHGVATINLIGSNIWTYQSVVGHSDAVQAAYCGGSKTLSSTLDRVRITTVNGTDTFDAGTINILYE